jgi:hypothetical protein
MSVALDFPLEHFDRLFQLRVTLPKRAPAGQPFVRGQTGEPACVDALADGQFSDRAEVIHIHLIGCGAIRQVESPEGRLIIRTCQSSGAIQGDHDAVCHAVGAQRGGDRLARDEFPRLRRSDAEGRVPAANQRPATVGVESDRADFKAVPAGGTDQVPALPAPIMPTPGLCRLSLGSSVPSRISLLASFERGDIIWKSFT